MMKTLPFGIPLGPRLRLEPAQQFGLLQLELFFGQRSRFAQTVELLDLVRDRKRGRSRLRLLHARGDRRTEP